MKDTFFKSAIILLIGGFLTKMLGMIIKIIMTRIVGIEGISLYMLVFPTFSLFMTLSQLGFPTALSKLIPEDIHNNKKLVLSLIPISLFINLILILIIIITSPTISKLLNDERTFYPILAIAFVLPIDSISNILRGYFFGKQRMIPHTISLLSEQIVRLLLIIFYIPKILYKGLAFVTTNLIGINMLSEFISILIMLLFIKEKSIKKRDLLPNKKNIKSIFEISIPTTASRLIGAITYFFEPIILTKFLIINKYSSSYIIKEYGIIEGYIIPLLLIPSFLSGAISNALLPDISKKIIKKDNINIKKRIKQVITISLLIGITTMTILFINPKLFLNLIYNYNNDKYIGALIPFFIILYLQYPIESTLQAFNKSKNIMINNLIGTITKLLSIILFSYFKIGLYNLVIAIIINIIITTILDIKTLKKELLNL